MVKLSNMSGTICKIYKIAIPDQSTVCKTFIVDKRIHQVRFVE